MFLLVCICGDQVFGFWYTESCFMLYSEAELKDPNHHFHEEERKGKEQEEENSPLSREKRFCFHEDKDAGKGSPAHSI